jgi:CheY-like chemotaxis protein
MFFDEWNVLVVDDEHDVLSVTKLALKDVKVYGLPIKLHTAGSKAEAIEVLKRPSSIRMGVESALAVAFIDVVMETQTAGLELCEYIRGPLKNKTAQLYVRTGQPGVAPERSVIDQYDISGYLTKVEATEQKLYSIVKTGIRQWFTFWYADNIAQITNAEIQNSTTKEQLLKMIDAGDPEFEPTGITAGIVFDNKHFITDRTQAQVQQLHDELDKVKPFKTWPEGHKLVIDGERLMVKVAATEHTVDYYYVINGHMPLPEALYDITFDNGLALSMLYKRAK